jgi:signal transduction histidine kinase/CHASE3 domain sensor protein
MRSRKATLDVPAAAQRSWLQRWWLDRSVRTKGLIVVAIPLIALTAVTSANLVLQYNERQARSVSVDGNNVAKAGLRVMADAVNAETGVRGYAATRDPLFLDPYALALSRIGADQAALRKAAAVQGDSRQQRLVSGTTTKVLSEIRQVRAAVDRGVPQRALVPLLERQQATMDLLRSQVADLVNGPTALLLSQRAKINRLEQAINVVDIAGLVLGLLAGLTGVALFTSGISRRVTAAAANADRLGEGQPLEPVERSADDLGHLADSIIRAGSLLAARAARRDRPRLALLAAIVDSSDDAIVSSGVDGLITSWNPAAEAIYGYSAAEAVGQRAEFIIEADRRAEEAEILSAFVASQGSNGNSGGSSGSGGGSAGIGSSAGSESSGSLHHETVQWRKGGTTFPASVMFSAIRDDDGTLIGTSSIARDITEQLRAETELHSRMTELERANQYLETFTYSVSHDLRAPLRGLAGFSAALMEDCGDSLGEDGRDYAERIQAASGRMAALIDDLLHLSRLWRTEIQDVKPVDLSAEVVSIVEELQHTAPERRVRFTIQDGVWAPADRVLIRSVLENLVGNAWKFTGRRDDALIEFGTLPTQEAPVCCFVRDNGAGFDAAYAGKLFVPFERLHTAAEFDGTGVGLASVQQIVERHGGRIWAEGAVGQGATFYFTLDAKETT